MIKPNDIIMDNNSQPEKIILNKFSLTLYIN